MEEYFSGIPTTRNYLIFKERDFTNWTSIHILKDLKDDNIKGICYITKYSAKRPKLFVFTKNKSKNIEEFTEKQYLNYTDNFDEIIKNELISNWMIEF